MAKYKLKVYRIRYDSKETIGPHTSYIRAINFNNASRRAIEIVQLYEALGGQFSGVKSARIRKMPKGRWEDLEERVKRIPQLPSRQP